MVPKIVQLKAELSEVYVKLEQLDNMKKGLLQKKAVLLNAIAAEQKNVTTPQQPGGKGSAVKDDKPEEKKDGQAA